MKRAAFFLTIILPLVAGPVRADIVIECAGHDRALNDYSQWDLKISGKVADVWGKHFSVAETKRYFILTRPDSQIRIDKITKRYVAWGPKGKKAPPIEWSRNVLGEGCDIPKLAPVGTGGN